MFVRGETMGGSLGKSESAATPAAATPVPAPKVKGSKGVKGRKGTKESTKAPEAAAPEGAPGASVASFNWKRTIKHRLREVSLH